MQVSCILSVSLRVVGAETILLSYFHQIFNLYWLHWQQIFVLPLRRFLASKEVGTGIHLATFICFFLRVYFLFLRAFCVLRSKRISKLIQVNFLSFVLKFEFFVICCLHTFASRIESVTFDTSIFGYLTIAAKLVSWTKNNSFWLVFELLDWVYYLHELGVSARSVNYCLRMLCSVSLPILEQPSERSTQEAISFTSASWTFNYSVLAID